MTEQKAAKNRCDWTKKQIVEYKNSMATVTFYGFGYNERLCGEIQEKINSNKTISRVKLIDRGSL